MVYGTVERFRDLIEKAKQVSEKAYCPISNFRVGAAIYAGTNIYVGCNVECDNYSNTLHAEEVAIGAMIVGGDIIPEAIAVYTKTGDFPCGMCRQTLFELGGDNLIVIACDDTSVKEKLIKELLPDGFRL